LAPPPEQQLVQDVKVIEPKASIAISNFVFMVKGFVGLLSKDNENLTTCLESD
jgi:hypothetical protein